MQNQRCTCFTPPNERRLHKMSKMSGIPGRTIQTQRRACASSAINREEGYFFKFPPPSEKGSTEEAQAPDIPNQGEQSRREHVMTGPFQSNPNCVNYVATQDIHQFSSQVTKGRGSEMESLDPQCHSVTRAEAAPGFPGAGTADLSL